MPPPSTYIQSFTSALPSSPASSCSTTTLYSGHLDLHANGLLHRRVTITSTATRTIHIMYATDALSDGASTEDRQSTIGADARLVQNSISMGAATSSAITSTVELNLPSSISTTSVQLPTAPTNPIGQPQSTSIALIAITASLGGVAMIILIIWLLSQWRGRRFIWLGKY